MVGKVIVIVFRILLWEMEVFLNWVLFELFFVFFILYLWKVNKNNNLIDYVECLILIII